MPRTPKEQTMAKAQDFNAVMKDAFAALPVDMEAFEKNLRATAALNEKLSDVVLGAAEETNETASNATKDALAAFAKVSKAKAQPADYVDALNAFANFAANQASKNAAIYSEITRKAQTQAFELVVAAGNEASNDAAAAVQKVANDTAQAVKKAASAK